MGAAAQSLRSLVRSARLHSLCSAHSLVIPVEAGASESFDEHSLTDAGLFTLAVLTTVCVEQAAKLGAAACRRRKIDFREQAGTFT